MKSVRQEAKDSGKKQYFTGISCVHGHLAPRWTSTGYCTVCLHQRCQTPDEKKRRSAYSREWAKRNPERQKLLAKKSENRNRSKINERVRQRRARDVEKARKRARIRYQNNIEMERKRRRDHYTQNAEKQRSYSQKWRRLHRVAVLSSLRSWRKNNPEKMRAASSLRRARLSSAQGTHTASDIVNIKTSQKGRCIYCKGRFGSKYHVDHVVPISRGGRNDKSNIQILCAPCNLKKHNKDPIAFAQSLGMML